MALKKLSRGVAHTLPADLQKALVRDKVAKGVWEDITPLARNEWICWVLNAKKKQTRIGRVEKTRSKLRSGMRRPCCFAGCTHR